MTISNCNDCCLSCWVLQTILMAFYEAASPQEGPRGHIYPPHFARQHCRDWCRWSDERTKGISQAWTLPLPYIDSKMAVDDLVELPTILPSPHVSPLIRRQPVASPGFDARRGAQTMGKFFVAYKITWNNTVNKCVWRRCRCQTLCSSKVNWKIFDCWKSRGRGHVPQCPITGDVNGETPIHHSTLLIVHTTF